jgi:RNA polymerase sigma-70 factor, ECF subfamily
MTPDPNVSVENNFQDFIARLKDHDERTWGHLDFVLKRIVFKWLGKKGINTTFALEIYNSSMAVLIEKMKKVQFDSYSGLKSYFFSIAENKVREFYRDISKRQLMDSENNLPETNYVFMLEEQENEIKLEKVQVVYKLINTLASIEKQVLTLLFKEEKSYEETAELLGITNGSLRVIKHRAIKKMKKLLAKHYNQ